MTGYISKERRLFRVIITKVIPVPKAANIPVNIASFRGKLKRKRINAAINPETKKAVKKVAVNLFTIICLS
jgi:hypothetical protein